MSLWVWVLWAWVSLRWSVGVIGFIGLRLAVHRHQVHTPALSGPCSAALHTARPPFGCSAKAAQAVMVLERCPSPAVRPLCIPATALLASFVPHSAPFSRAWYAGAPPWGAARLATLGCAAVMLFAGQRTRPTRSKKPAIRLRGTDWCLHGGFASFVPHLLCRHSRPQPSGGTAPLAAAVPSTMLQGPASIGQECRT